MKFNNLVLIFILLLTVQNVTSAQSTATMIEWPQWRGPDRSGVWYNGPSITHLDESRIKYLWEYPIGHGYSGPTCADGLIFITDYADSRERVICLNNLTGEKIWSYEYKVTYTVGYPTGPRASVLVHEGLAYSFGTMGNLFCFNAETGIVVWTCDALTKYNIQLPIWGLAASPIIEDDLIILQLGGHPGSCLVAFNRMTGQEVWRSMDDEASYSAPILIDQAGKRVLVCWTGENIVGLDPATGFLYWGIPTRPQQMIMNVASPVYAEPYLFLSAFFDGSYLLKLDTIHPTADLVYYRHGESERMTDALHCCISTPIIAGNYLYGVDSYGEVRCLELITGDRIWENRNLVRQGRWSNIHFIVQDNFVWGFNEEGDLLLGKFTPSGYEDHGKVRVIDPVNVSPNPRNGVCWSHPAFAGNRIYLRNDEKLVCIEINDFDPIKGIN